MAEVILMISKKALGVRLKLRVRMYRGIPLFQSATEVLLFQAQEQHRTTTRDGHGGTTQAVEKGQPEKKVCLVNAF
jgi:hypothetical protein